MVKAHFTVADMPVSTPREREALRDVRASMLVRAEAGQTYQQIADFLSTEDNVFPVGTVKSGIHRARAQIIKARKKALSEMRHPNGAPMFNDEGMMLDDQGNRSIFDDVDE